MVRVVLTWVAAMASVLGLVYTIWPVSSITGHQGVAIGLLGAVFIAAGITDVREHLRKAAKRIPTDGKMNDYMFQWISRGGRVVIFTRDHTWAQEPRIRELLITKARRQELTICLPVETTLTRELASDGATVITYPHLAYTPGARFTIVNEGQNAVAAVAIGRRDGDVRIVEEFPIGDPVFAIAKDLVEVLRRVSA